MKKIFGSLIFIFGLWLFYDIFISPPINASWWDWLQAGVATIWGLELLITGFLDEAREKSSDELRIEMRRLKDEIEDDYYEY